MSTLPMDPPPSKPRYVLIWRGAEQARTCDGWYRIDDYPTYKWVWGWNVLPFATVAEAEAEVDRLVRTAGDRYAGDRNGSTGYEWQGGGTVTLADVEIMDLQTLRRIPVYVLARIKRAAMRARRDRDRWLRDYAEQQRAEKVERLNALKRELGEP